MYVQQLSLPKPWFVYVQVQQKSCKRFFFVVVAKAFRTWLFHERNCELDRCGFLFLWQEHSTDKNKFISTSCNGTPFRQMQP
jgi:hypothetical protein